MRKEFAMFALMTTLAACASPPAQPGALWDSLPSSQGGAAKEVPAKIWEAPSGDSPEDPSVDVSAEPPVVDVRGAVILNEIFYDSAESDTDGHLFVELYGEAGLEIGGCKIAFVNGSDGGVYDTITIPVDAKIREDGFYLIADGKTGSSTESNVPGADLIDTFDPQNGPDAVQLIDSQGALVDAVGYGEGILSPAQNGLAAFEGTPATDVVSGHSLERKVVGVDTDDNAADFVDRSDPTPGFSPDPPVDPSPKPPETVPVDPEPPMPPPSGPSSDPETPPASKGKVVLNEIFYDAVGSDLDGVLFVELFGDSGKEIGNYRINFVDGADGSIDDSVILPPEAHLRSDGFYLIGDTKNGLSSDTSVLGADFIDNFDPANGPDAVQLLDDAGGLVDAVGYGEGILGIGQNGLADFEKAAAPDVVNGHSLERRSSGFDTDDNFDDFLDRETPTPGL